MTRRKRKTTGGKDNGTWCGFCRHMLVPDGFGRWVHHSDDDWAGSSYHYGECPCVNALLRCWPEDERARAGRLKPPEPGGRRGLSADMVIYDEVTAVSTAFRQLNEAFAGLSADMTAGLASLARLGNAWAGYAGGTAEPQEDP